MWCQKANPGQLHASQVPNLVYYHSNFILIFMLTHLTLDAYILGTGVGGTSGSAQGLLHALCSDITLWTSGDHMECPGLNRGQLC